MRIQLLQRPTGSNKLCLKTCIGSLIIIYILLWISKPELDKIFQCRQDGQELEQLGALKQTSTHVSKSDVDAAFIENWCRQRRTRLDWRALLSSCKDKTAWDASRDEQNATDANNSFISHWDINPAGEFTRFSIQSQTKDFHPKKHGGDSWRVHVYGPSSISTTIIDHSNGTYEVLFLAMEAGVYKANITLDFTLCNGLRDPPVDWFIVGNAQGKMQRYPDVERNRDYLQAPLWQGTLVEIRIPPAKDGSISQNYISIDRVQRLSNTNCDVDCGFIWDGYGRWVGNTWRSQLKGTSKSKSPRNKEGTLWVYGDSVNVFFAQSLMNGKLCREIFERCNFSYNWIYPVNNVTLARKENDNFDYDNERVLQAFRRVVHSPEMDEKSAVILNFGLHFVESINFANYKNLINGLVDVLEETETQYHSNSTRLKFRGTKIWKTTTAINKEKSSNIHLGHKRFMTQQRVMLYNTYANSRMCEAGFHVLDVFPITDSYPQGTGTHGAHGPVPNDIVHYSNLAFSPVEDLLEEFFSA